MKKVLFVDERKYRFSFYYESEVWWIKRGIKPYFKSYEGFLGKWIIYVWLILFRPDFIVFVQLSKKNFFLCKLGNILSIKTIFWQHGIFNYNNGVIKSFFKPSLDFLLCLSDFDSNKIMNYFFKASSRVIINHYDLNKIVESKKCNNSILYIGQIFSKEQWVSSSATLKYDKLCDDILSELWIVLSKLDFTIYLKKHPGDKSDYLVNLCKIYSNFQMINDHVIPKIVLSHYSTLIIPYLQLNIPFIQLHHFNNININFNAYSNMQFKTISSLEDLNSLKEYINSLESSTPNLNVNSDSISEIIRKIVTNN
ncbi:hypothetical protein [Algoriphagus sanaruensis]|uniref:Uncharacterized protein n=1 Tax=Algoriphagus sanaruensis TaxID=1727163 RepID=A0A142EQW8_9BACT|nr:hypothetical protein [Algoriphagus sanaruensis]AMQ57523.1 hypothetical protein AO498_13825 [Algoriphagus sanaruensis]